METGHRQQKKAETKAALIKGAFELFAEKGYDKTTIADIALRANCASRTFFLYFKSKEALLPAAIQEASSNLHAFMLGRASLGTVDALEQWLYSMLENHQAEQRRGLLSKDVAFQSRRKFYTTRLMQPILADEFGKDFGVEATAPRPQLLATMAMILLDVFDFDFSDDERLEFINEGMRVLRAGV